MPTGPKKHLKRLNAPKHWMLDKLSGIFVSWLHNGGIGVASVLAAQLDSHYMRM